MQRRDARPLSSRGAPLSSLAPTISAARCGKSVDSLTPAEVRVFDELLTGQTTVVIARALCVTEATVRTHLTHIYDKLGVRGRIELLAALASPVNTEPSVPPAVRPPSLSWPVLRNAGIRAAVLLAFAAGFAHLIPLAWPLVGPLLLAGQALISRRPQQLAVRLSMLAVGVLLSAEQVTVLVALHGV